MLEDAMHPPERSRAEAGPLLGTAALRRRLTASAAGDAIGSVLDLRTTGDHVVHTLTPGFCRAASVYVLERWLVGESAGMPVDPPRIEARRLALRMGPGAREEHSDVLPIGEVLVFPRDTPYVRALATGQPQILAAVDAHTADRLASSGPGDARIDALLRTTSFLVAPLRLRGSAVGFIACTRGEGEPAFSVADVAAVESLATRAVVALDNARLYERERRTALAIRASLLPTGAASGVEGCRVAHAYRPAGDGDLVGGDWFDVLRRSNDRVGLIVGDAMGHGPEAAVAMIQLRTAARTLAGLDVDPQGLMRGLDALAADTPGASFATCVYAEWDLRRGVCTLISAGHPPPLIRVNGGPAQTVALSAGLPLGLGDWTGEPVDIPVRESTLLLLYSDGLVESRDADIDVGIARLARALDEVKDIDDAEDADDGLSGVCGRIMDSPLTAGTADDLTLLLARLTPPTS
ncbi:GAF domain-containing SpoIIE family protein phosphatase [Actinacidiphila oryziradicis]|uniref:PP2C family protein-serine/threonine phosphatase n=1 Tax=Actinacidiphila oryziradicis TaxID=2571141 RepID=UPI003211E71D